MKYEYDEQTEEPGCGVKFLRVVFLALSVLLLIGGIVVIAGGVVMKQRNELVKYCSVCNDLYLYVIVSAAVLAGVSLIGVVALVCRNGCIIVLYSIVQGLLSVVVLAMIVIVVLFKMDRLNDILLTAWKKTPDDVRCATETGSKCSGWDTLCPMLLPPVRTELCPSCPNNLIIANYTETCHAVFKKEVSQWYGVIIGICAALAVICIISILVACKLVRKKSESSGQAAE